MQVDQVEPGPLGQVGHVAGRQAGTAPATARCLDPCCPQAPHPFDTLEGQAALTSPFAAGAFHSAGGRSDSSSCAAAAGPGGAAAGRRGGRDCGPHDSVDTRSSRSTLSRSSLQGYLAKCARIETKSMQPGALPLALPPAGSADLAAAADGAAAPSSAAGGSASTTSAAAAATGSGLPPLLAKSPTPARQLRRSALELQPRGGLTAEETAALAEGGDVLGAGALLPLQQGRAGMSSEDVSLGGSSFCRAPLLPQCCAHARVLQKHQSPSACGVHNTWAHGTRVPPLGDAAVSRRGFHVSPQLDISKALLGASCRPSSPAAKPCHPALPSRALLPRPPPSPAGVRGQRCHRRQRLLWRPPIQRLADLPLRWVSPASTRMSPAQLLHTVPCTFQASGGAPAV